GQTHVGGANCRALAPHAISRPYMFRTRPAEEPPPTSPNCDSDTLDRPDTAAYSSCRQYPPDAGRHRSATTLWMDNSGMHYKSLAPSRLPGPCCLNWASGSQNQNILTPHTPDRPLKRQ